MSEIEAVSTLMEQWVSAVNAGDVDAWLATLADDATIMPPNGPAVSGKEALGPWMSQTFFDPFDTQLSSPSDEFVVGGDLVIARGTYHLSLNPKDGSQTVEDNGKYVDVFKRQSDGSFKFKIVMWSSNNPPSGQ